MKNKFLQIARNYLIAFSLIIFFSGVEAQDPCEATNLVATDITHHSAHLGWDDTLCSDW